MSILIENTMIVSMDEEKIIYECNKICDELI